MPMLAPMSIADAALDDGAQSIRWRLERGLGNFIENLGQHFKAGFGSKLQNMSIAPAIPSD
jgi:hypothetical protein